MAGAGNRVVHGAVCGRRRIALGRIVAAGLDRGPGGIFPQFEFNRCHPLQAVQLGSDKLEAQLEARLKRSLLAEVRSITPPGLTVISVSQAEAKGLGHAILCARPVVGDEPFAVLLPDVLIDNAECNLKQDNLAGMVKRFEASGHSQILVEDVPHEQVDKYGVVDCSGAVIAAGETAPVKAMVEKPPLDEAPSNMAIVGRYILSKTTWNLLAKTMPGAGGEIQLTDALDALLEQETIEAYQLVGRSHDCGSKMGYLKAIVTYAERHPEVGRDFMAFLKTQV